MRFPKLKAAQGWLSVVQMLGILALLGISVYLLYKAITVLVKGWTDAKNGAKNLANDIAAGTKDAIDTVTDPKKLTGAIAGSIAGDAARVVDQAPGGKAAVSFIYNIGYKLGQTAIGKWIGEKILGVIPPGKQYEEAGFGGIN